MNFISRMHEAAPMQFSTIIQSSKFKNYLMRSQLNCPPFYVTFHQYHKCLTAYIGVVGNYSSGRLKTVWEVRLPNGLKGRPLVL